MNVSKSKTQISVKNEFDPLHPLKHIKLRFTEEQIQVIDAWFEENAKPLLVINEQEPVNGVSVEQFLQFVQLKKFHRRSYRYPTYADIMREAESLKMEIVRMFNRDQVVYILEKYIIEPDMKHELTLAFKVFDTEQRNFLDVEQLQEIVTRYGENSFSEAELIEFLREADVRGDGNVFYNDLIESMFSVAPELHQMEKEYLYEDPDEDPSVPPLPPPPKPVELQPPTPSQSPPPLQLPPPQRVKKEKGKGKKK